MSILEFAVVRACERFQHNGQLFNTANFQQELSRVTDSWPMVTPKVAEAVLLSVPGVRRDGPCHWKYEG